MPISLEQARAVFISMDEAGENFLASSGAIAKKYIKAVANTSRDPQILAQAIKRLHGVKLQEQNLLARAICAITSGRLLASGDFLQRLSRANNPLMTSRLVVQLAQHSSKLLSSQNIARVFHYPRLTTVSVMLIKHDFIEQAHDKSEARKILKKLEAYGADFIDRRILRDILQLRNSQNIFSFLDKVKSGLTRSQMRSLMTSEFLIAVSCLGRLNTRSNIDSLSNVLVLLAKRMPAALTQQNLRIILDSDDMYKAMVIVLFNSLHIEPYSSVVNRITANIEHLKLLAKRNFVSPVSLSSEPYIGSPELLALDIALIHSEHPLHRDFSDPERVKTIVRETVTDMLKDELKNIFAYQGWTDVQKLNHFYCLQLLGFDNYRHVLAGEDSFTCLASSAHSMTAAEALKNRAMMVMRLPMHQIKTVVNQNLHRAGIHGTTLGAIEYHIIRALIDLRGLNVELSSEQRQQLMPTDSIQTRLVLDDDLDSDTATVAAPVVPLTPVAGTVTAAMLSGLAQERARIDLQDDETRMAAIEAGLDEVEADIGDAIVASGSPHVTSATRSPVARLIHVQSAEPVVISSVGDQVDRRLVVQVGKPVR